MYVCCHIACVCTALLGICFGERFFLIESVNTNLFERTNSPSLLSCSRRCAINLNCNVFAYNSRTRNCDLGTELSSNNMVFSGNGTLIFSLNSGSSHNTTAAISESPDSAYPNSSTTTAATATTSANAAELSTYQTSFVVVNESLSWSNAETHCDTNFNGLAAIVNATVQEVLRQTIESSGLAGPFWTAGRVGVGGSWYWNFKDGTQEIFTWTNWNTGEPSSSFNYMHIMDSTTNFTWEAAQAPKTKFFLCSL